MRGEEAEKLEFICREKVTNVHADNIVRMLYVKAEQPQCSNFMLCNGDYYYTVTTLSIK